MTSDKVTLKDIYNSRHRMHSEVSEWGHRELRTGRPEPETAWCVATQLVALKSRLYDFHLDVLEQLSLSDLTEKDDESPASS